MSIGVLSTNTTRFYGKIKTSTWDECRQTQSLSFLKTFWGKCSRNSLMQAFYWKVLGERFLRVFSWRRSRTSAFAPTPIIWVWDHNRLWKGGGGDACHSKVSICTASLQQCSFIQQPMYSQVFPSKCKQWTTIDYSRKRTDVAFACDIKHLTSLS